MRIPIIASDPEFTTSIENIFSALNDTLIPPAQFQFQNHASHESDFFRGVPLHSQEAAVEYVNYHTPELMIIDFTDEKINSFGVMEKIIEDHWLNNGGIIAIYQGARTDEKITNIENTNILITVPRDEISRYLLKALKILRDNQHFLFQRAFQKYFVSNMRGHFDLDNDLAVVPLYANLIANYLYNIGALEDRIRAEVRLSLIEMLNNAIEHGNCEISAKEKTEHLAKDFNMKSLIEEKLKDPELNKRRTYFGYQIEGDSSAFVIRDEGKGFDWKAMLADDREIDYLADHGRGIWMTKLNVHQISYNESGNEVTIVVKHSETSPTAVPAGFRNQETITVNPDDIICHQGEESSSLYYILEGEYRVEVGNKEIALLTPKDLFLGEMAFLLQERRSATVIANTEGTLIKFTKESFVTTLKEHPYYGLFLAKLLADRLQKMSWRFAH